VETAEIETYKQEIQLIQVARIGRAGRVASIDSGAFRPNLALANLCSFTPKHTAVMSPVLYTWRISLFLCLSSPFCVSKKEKETA
jgi:hypothetical protein